MRIRWARPALPLLQWPRSRSRAQRFASPAPRGESPSEPGGCEILPADGRLPPGRLGPRRGRELGGRDRAHPRRRRRQPPPGLRLESELRHSLRDRPAGPEARAGEAQGVPARERPGPAPDPAQGTDRGRQALGRRPPRPRARAGLGRHRRGVPADRALPRFPAEEGQAVEGRPGERLRPRRESAAAPGRLDLRGRRRPADPAGLVRYAEVEAGFIDHAIRITFERTRRAYLSPASHYASEECGATLPPMGMRLRLREGYDLGGMSDEARTIAQALKTYGAIVADNGSNFFITGASDRALGRRRARRPKGRSRATPSRSSTRAPSSPTTAEEPLVASRVRPGRGREAPSSRGLIPPPSPLSPPPSPPPSWPSASPGQVRVRTHLAGLPGVVLSLWPQERWRWLPRPWPESPL